jgi:hypothetical protein
LKTRGLKVRKEELQMIYTTHETGTSVRLLRFDSMTVWLRILRCLSELGQEGWICVCVCVSECECVSECV